MTEQTQEQLDLIYEPLQQNLRDAYMLYISTPYDEKLSYSEWLEFELAELNYEIAELQEQQ